LFLTRSIFGAKGGFVKYWLVWGLYIVAWTILLEIPKRGVDQLSVSVDLTGYTYFLAKTLHVAMYAVLAILSSLVPLSARYRFALMFVLMAHATITELLQEMLEPYCHRGGSLHDVGYDHLGIAIGVALSWKRWTRPD
jgi:hypothetical protein